MGRLYNLLCKLKNPKPYHYVRITKDAKADLLAWQIFITSHFKGKCLFLHPSWKDHTEIELFTDAATTTGCAGVFKCQWFNLPWPDSWKSKNITFLKLYPIWVSLELWDHLFKNHQIRFRSDNAAVVYIINKKSSKDNDIMSLMRSIVVLTMKFNVNISAAHIPGSSNVIADLLSRFQVERARSIKSDLRDKPSPPNSLIRDSAQLVNSSLAANSRKLYSHSLKQFKTFINNS